MITLYDNHEPTSDHCLLLLLHRLAIYWMVYFFSSLTVFVGVIFHALSFVGNVILGGPRRPRLRNFMLLPEPGNFLLNGWSLRGRRVLIQR